MPLNIRKYVKKSGETSWYAVLRHQGKQTYLKDEALITAGLSPDMTHAEALERARTLNAQEHLKWSETKRAAIAERLTRERLEQLAYLPEADIVEFETKIMAPMFMGSSTVDPKHKIMVKWRAALRAMREVKLDPTDWSDRPFDFYNYFLAHKFSPGYVERIISLMNHYGYFYCKKHRQAFLPLPKLKGKLKHRQINAYRGKSKRGVKSDPLSPTSLETQKDNLTPPNYDWLYLAVWLGMRPEEIDNLKRAQPGYEHYTTTVDGVTVLHIYQTKLVEAVDEQDRWKMIPLLYPQQVKCIEVIKRGQFKRPLTKTLKKYFTERTTTYCGRKGFTDLMLSRGQRFEDISQWMGHESLDRTWTDYKNRRVVHFIKPSKKAA